MEFIKSKKVDIDGLVLPIDEYILDELGKMAFKCSKDTEVYNVRDQLYNTSYNPHGLEGLEKSLEVFLTSRANSNVRTSKQNAEYNWVKINTYNMGNIDWRFYIAPKPSMMYEIVGRLTDAFIMGDVPVRFKYQLTTNMDFCDRIIIYSDSVNRNIVEETINKVYRSNPSLFNGCERSLAWLYESKVPHVYMAPETPGIAYSTELANAIMDAKKAFKFIYDMRGSGGKLTLIGEEAEKAARIMRVLIASMLFRHCLLLSRDRRSFVSQESKMFTHYDDTTGVLRNSINTNQGYYEASYTPTDEGAVAFLENFYTAMKVKQQPGVTVRYLTLAERKAELDRFFYPHLFPGNNGVNGGIKR